MNEKTDAEPKLTERQRKARTVLANGVSRPKKVTLLCDPYRKAIS